LLDDRFIVLMVDEPAMLNALQRRAALVQQRRP
jgi:hypothetical protein